MDVKERIASLVK